MTTICISAGHSAKCPGAIGLIDEFTENKHVAQRVNSLINTLPGHKSYCFVDMTSTTQQVNLDTIVDWHNSMSRDLDVSVHFNSSGETCSQGLGVEVLYVTQSDLAEKLSAAIAHRSGLIDRGAKLRNDLFFLNNTHEAAVLVEVCFVNSEADVKKYQKHFAGICQAIAETVTGKAADAAVPLFETSGPVSWFGGPDDDGVAPDEGLAFIHQTTDRPEVFLSYQPAGTTGLARRLDPDTFYVACRWDYDITPKEQLLHEMAWVETPSGDGFLAFPADWGPHASTGRAADISPGLMAALGVETDDVVRVVFPGVLPTRPLSPPELKPTALVTINIQSPPNTQVAVTLNGKPL